jgi:hypothetical protein
MDETRLAEIAVGIAVAMIPFLTVAGLLGLSAHLRRREDDRISRQVAVTDAMHRELGAAAAPEVRRDWLGGWTVSAAVPFEQEEAVAAVARIVHEFFVTFYPKDAPRLRVLLTPRKRTPGQAPASPVTRLAAGNLTRVA